MKYIKKFFEGKNMRKFDKLDEKTKIRLLFSSLQMALSETEEMRGNYDIYDIAIQYRPILKKEDFELIKNKTVDELVQLFSK